MFDKQFIELLNMSYVSSIVILFILIARLLLKKAPKIFSYLLWGIPLIRLVCPISFESLLSIIPTNTKPIPMDIGYSSVPHIDTGNCIFRGLLRCYYP